MGRVRSVFVGFFRALNEFLQHPPRVLWLCGVLLVLNLVLDGSLFSLWRLNIDLAQIQNETQIQSTRSEDLKLQLKRARDPAFLEKEARDRFDLVSEGDLVFVFADEQ